MPHGPLAGVTVVENASGISGPYAGLLPAQLGADVVTVEAPGNGDPFRRCGGTTAGERARPQSASLGHSERSLASDLRDADGRAAHLDLHAGADVPAAPVEAIDEVVGGSHVRRTGLLRQATAPAGESFLVPRGALAFAGDIDACSMEVPVLGG